jgi:hypothetical protein
MLSDGSEINAELGSPDEIAFTSAVGSTSHVIRSSNLPMFYVLPDDFQLTVGVPTTYRGFAIGGAKIGSSDRWNTLQGGALSGFYPGAASFTFTPQKTGHATVCLGRGPGTTPMDQLGACFDPPVRKAVGGGATSPPTDGTPDSSSPPDPSVPSVPPTEAAASGTPASSEGPTTSPSDVAIAAANADATDGSAGSPNQRATSGPSAPGLVWVAVMLAAAVLAGGAAVLLRPDIRARIRSRTGR